MSDYKRLEISAVTFERVSLTELQDVDGEAVQMMLDICDNERDHDFRTKTNIYRSLQNTGSDCDKARSSRAAPVCSVLLCFLLIAVIVLCVYIYTNATNHTQKRNELLTRITNLTKERDELLNRSTSFTEDQRQLLTKNTELTRERVELLSKITRLTEDRNKLINRNTDFTDEQRQLQTKNTELTNERDELLSKIASLTEEKNNLNKKNDELNYEKEQIMIHIQNNFKEDGLIYYQSHFYYLSNKKKSWIESKRDCMQRQSDLVIINNKEEQDFVKRITQNNDFWIGLTDSDVEGRWKWVDGSAMTLKFWASEEPNGGTKENCVVTHLKSTPSLVGWIDEACDRAYQWICEKRILP